MLKVSAVMPWRVNALDGILWEMNALLRLDPCFVSEAEFNAAYRRAIATSTTREPFAIGLEREGCSRSRFESEIDPEHPLTQRFVERMVKFLLWSRGGWRLTLGGPASALDTIAAKFRRGRAREFDSQIMERAYGRPFEVRVCGCDQVLDAKEPSHALGGHLDGCRIGFDLGASDFKIAAVREGNVVYSCEIPWNPRVEPDPTYHWEKLQTGLQAAARMLPRVDAIGGSSAGVIVGNEIRVASLFRAVSESDFDRSVRGMFRRLSEHWGVPVEVVNDGEVTALAGTMSLGVKGLLGIAMGSSEAAGYINRQGHLTDWLNELAFAPVDSNPAAAYDEWSGDRGVGALYFSQQAVNRLLPASGIEADPALGLPERLVTVQKLMAQNDPRAADIFEVIGTYLGHTICLYADYYEFDNLLLLGRVTSGPGGELLLKRAKQVLASLSPELSERIQIHVPDEKSRRVGQAVAAASLPCL